MESKYFTSAVLAELTGIPGRTLREWRNQGILPQPDAPMEEQITAIVYYLRQQALRSKDPEEQGELYQEQVRLTKARADRTELEIAQIEEDLVNGEEVAAVWMQYVGACRARLLAIPSRLTPELAVIIDPIEINELLSNAIDEALIELSRGLEAEVEKIDRPTE